VLAFWDWQSLASQAWRIIERLQTRSNIDVRRERNQHTSSFEVHIWILSVVVVIA